MEKTKVVFSEEVKYFDMEHGNQMPIIELVNEDTKEAVGYLSPFRFYKFQISATFDGQRDLGGSDVIKFENYFNIMSDEMLFEMIRGQIAVALTDFANNCTGSAYDIPKVFRFWNFNGEQKGINQFILETIRCFRESSYNRKEN